MCWSGRIRAGCCIAALLLMPEMSMAQTGQISAPVLTLDQDRLFASSRFGQQLLAEVDTEVKALQAENRKLEADLEAEEKRLTEQRATLSAEDFRLLAEAFDAKVKGIRSARDAKASALAARRDAARKTFFETAIPILAEIMREAGAVAVIDRSAIVLSFDRIDVTDLAVARIDAQLVPEAAKIAPPAAPETRAPAPDPAPAPDE